MGYTLESAEMPGALPPPVRAAILAHRFVSIHPFVKDRDFMGGKTGHTSAAKDTMLTILNVNGQPVAIVVLSSDDRKKDTLLLLNSIKEKLKN